MDITWKELNKPTQYFLDHHTDKTEVLCPECGSNLYMREDPVNINGHAPYFFQYVCICGWQGFSNFRFNEKTGKRYNTWRFQDYWFGTEDETLSDNMTKMKAFLT